jgi:hypothetical protein
MSDDVDVFDFDSCTIETVANRVPRQHGVPGQIQRVFRSDEPFLGSTRDDLAIDNKRRRGIVTQVAKGKQGKWNFFIPEGKYVVKILIGLGKKAPATAWQARISRESGVAEHNHGVSPLRFGDFRRVTK